MIVVELYNEETSTTKYRISAEIGCYLWNEELQMEAQTYEVDSLDGWEEIKLPEAYTDEYWVGKN